MSFILRGSVPPPTRRGAVIACATALALSSTACVDGTIASPQPGPDTSLRRRGDSITNGDALAAAWLLAAGAVPSHASVPAPPTALDAALARRIRHHARDHIWCSSVGSGDGPGLAGSARIRRLAAGGSAPSDVNGNGTNLDETLDVELREIAALAGTSWPVGLAPVLSSRAGATATLVDPRGPANRDDLEAMRTMTQDRPELDPEALGWTLLSRTWLAQALAGERRGASIGLTEQDGRLAVLAIEQALAIEETVLTDLAFDGEVFVPIADPRDYDPTTEPRWLPGLVRWTPRTALPGAPSDWLAVDQSSDLMDLAVLMRAAAELGWLTDPANPDPRLSALFSGTVFEPPSGGPPAREITWVDDVRPILHGNAGCLGCHGPPVLNNNYSVAQFEHVFRTGLSGVPGVVVGDHAASALWRSIDGEWTPPGFGFPLSRMPFGQPRLPQTDIDLIARWIDEGARREQPPARPAPRPGLDLARVLFRIAIALHETVAGPHTGLLDRRAGAARSELVAAADTGAFLVACAALASLDESEPDLDVALERLADAAARWLSEADGVVHAELDLRNGTPSSSPAGLADRAALGAGLLAAGRVTGRTDLAVRGLAIADRLIADSWHPLEALFDSRVGDQARVLRARDLAFVVELLREAQLAGHSEARAVLEALTDRVIPATTQSELEGDGEILRDGSPDSDGDLISEPGAAGLAPLLSGLVQEGPEPPPSSLGPVTWSAQVLPLFRARCAGCHVDGVAEGGYRVDTARLAATPGDSRSTRMIVPGDPDASFLIEKLARRVPSSGAQMPQRAPPLAAHELAIVRGWISDGARDR
jgi:hypothetical protein